MNTIVSGIALVISAFAFVGGCLTAYEPGDSSDRLFYMAAFFLIAAGVWR
mgnify:CR=1 FL=1